jgi:hypothetical protein
VCHVEERCEDVDDRVTPDRDRRGRLQATTNVTFDDTSVNTSVDATIFAAR